ncbi:hypothetical protein [Rhodococcus rhodochrous]|uniref:hypothetical protein n=1 Tax=Rhodococcus rhodochrous TaxID=1829 RepID=UPI00178011B1|nr:hypothetical protein [Rhodococcus rhodochrous]
MDDQSCAFAAQSAWYVRERFPWSWLRFRLHEPAAAEHASHRFGVRLEGLLDGFVSVLEGLHDSFVKFLVAVLVHDECAAHVAHHEGAEHL